MNLDEMMEQARIVTVLEDRIKELEAHLEIATAMFDPENQPPQWSPEEALGLIYGGHQESRHGR